MATIRVRKSNPVTWDIPEIGADWWSHRAAIPSLILRPNSLIIWKSRPAG